MKYNGVVFFDYDGTLADEKSGIYYPTKKTAEAVDILNKKGYLTVVASGRSKCYLPKTDAMFGGIICSNGAYAEVDGRGVYKRSINADDLSALSSAIDNMGLYYSIENQERCYAKDLSNPEFLQMLNNFGIPLDIFYPMSEWDNGGVQKLLLAYKTEENFEILSEQFKGVFCITRHRLNKSADINNAAVTKENGVLAIMNAFDIPRENTYAFGDGENDYEMLRSVGHGIAMGTHADCLLEVAERVTNTVRDEGIWAALSDYGLI